MSSAAPLPKDSPIIKAWDEFKQTEEYANSKKWAAYEPQVDGSLWAMYDAGWKASQDRLQAKVRELEAENAELRAKLHDLQYFHSQEALRQQAGQEDNG